MVSQQTDGEMCDIIIIIIIIMTMTTKTILLLPNITVYFFQIISIDIKLLL